MGSCFHETLRINHKAGVEHQFGQFVRPDYGHLVILTVRFGFPGMKNVAFPTARDCAPNAAIGMGLRPSRRQESST